MAVKIDLAARTVVLGVSDLVATPIAFGPGMGFSTWTRWALGREVHTRRQTAQAAECAGYAREVSIRHCMTVDDFHVTIQGRIDGVYPDGTVEEIKSVVLPPLAFAALSLNAYPHYVEQVRLYCYLLERAACMAATALQPKRVSGRLVFINVADGARKEFTLQPPFDDCDWVVTDRVRTLISAARSKQAARDQRRAAATTLAFPYGQPRRYQDEMIAAVERALASGRHLLVSAPSGIGKTAAALFPAVRHVLENGGRVFFVTAKNTQQAIVLETLQRLGVATAVQFRAREQLCVNDQYACREEFCEYLRDVSLKLEQTSILRQLLTARLVLPDALAAAGRKARVCPFELALLAAEQADVIVGDYNYVFDPQVYLRGFFQETDYSDAVLIIDEAHNLVQRAMDYYSPALSRTQVQALRQNLPDMAKPLREDLQAFLTKIERWFSRTARLSNEPKFLIESPEAFFEKLKPEFHKLSVRYLLEKVLSGRSVPDDPVEEFFAAFAQFTLVLGLGGEEFSYIFDTANGQAVKILCKDPSRQLAERLAGFHSVIAMSATLQPTEFYRQMLGFDPERTDELVLPSPFPRRNRRILIVPQVLTTYRARAANYAKTAQLIARTVRARRGNYMALFPSYEFLRNVAEKLPAGDWELRVQDPQMTHAQREELVQALSHTEPPKLVLAVQGGLFAEGVDYPGEKLCGVIVVSPALPQVSFERELMRQYYADRYGKGFEFAYLYPGMNRVIQSAGRLIRSETDRGVILLVCQRFRTPQYTSLFPPDWLQDAEELLSRNLDAELAEFWAAERCE